MTVQPSMEESWRAAIEARKLAPEETIVAALLDRLQLNAEQRARTERLAAGLVERVRSRRGDLSFFDAFLAEFGLSNKEGVALMCLAEALLRIPDAGTADLLIAEKIGGGNWAAHRGRSASRLVNASSWALALAGHTVAGDRSDTTRLEAASPVDQIEKFSIRRALLAAMSHLNGAFVLGQTIDEALARSESLFKPGTRFSFDMLGEGARTESAARQYFDAYADAIKRVGKANRQAGALMRSGVSIKLSALHPRYEFAQHDRVVAELGPRLDDLAARAARAGIGLTIDAEEADRLELSLELFERLARSPATVDWQGLGLAIQAYGKRAVPVLEWLAHFARRSGRQFTVRLVKGAYWDTEIKRAQELGLEGFPVFTRKEATDLSYLVCAEMLLACRDCIYPQFATHNAHTISAIMEMVGSSRGFEFQRLYGMNPLVYDEAARVFEDFPLVRVYAPVGRRKDLLAYLVRRLLENGANSSFLHQMTDEHVTPGDVARDPIDDLRKHGSVGHPDISAPLEIFGAERRNSAGLDLAASSVVTGLVRRVDAEKDVPVEAGPIVDGLARTQPAVPVTNPADLTQVAGSAAPAAVEEVGAAAEAARAAQESWDRQGGSKRAQVLEAAADLLESERPRLMGLLVHEGGKTLPDALAEVREAVDFCRYYAQEARRHFAEAQSLPGPTGERNQLSLHGRGVFACISPWNFPLAIFVGQVAAALAAGNAVLAKPAEQTPLIGFEAIKLLHRAGVPAGVLHYLPGTGEQIGRALVEHPLVAGVAFTGSSETARIINRALAARPGPILPLIAETGGQNVMFVDSTALLEQMTDDVIRSAFHSAGQRCSALRVLYLQDDIADAALDMIKGAMAELAVGNPASISTDVGPIIDQPSLDRLAAHIERMEGTARWRYAATLPDACKHGTFLAPHLFEIDRIADLTHEVFGPVLHVIRFRAQDLDRLVREAQSAGYGLTLGVHSRIASRARKIFQCSPVGNTYVNRNMVGAVVGVQPFGGHGLSGTGPKAGGPHYLFRFATEKALSVNMMAEGGNVELLGGIR